MSRIKDGRWDCTECGTNQGSNDMWFENDVCGECNSKKLTEAEKIFLETFCYDESRKIKREHGLNYISGGFCNVEFDSCYESEIILKVTLGSVDEESELGNTHTDYLILDRETLTYKETQDERFED